MEKLSCSWLFVILGLSRVIPRRVLFIADKDLNAEFIRKYNIAAIPRFILIDPTGRIVSGNALRPSDPGLREMLDKLL